MMTAIVCLTGCGKTQTTLEYDEAMIEQETEFLINYCQNVDSDTLAHRTALMAQLTAGRQESKNAVSMSDMEIIHLKRKMMS